MASVTVRSVSKSFGPRRVLDNVSLDIPDGSVYGLIGPNGAGKTTLLSILAGLRRPDEGMVAIDGAPPSEARIGFMPDTPRDYPWLTVEESLKLAARLCGVDDVDATVGEAMETFGLSGSAGVRQGSLSRGMRQRAALAATLMGFPEVVVLDEPCSALDPLGRADVLHAIAALKGRSTVVFSTHLLADVERICDRVAVIFRGEIVAEDSLDGFLGGEAAPGFVIILDRHVPGLLERFLTCEWCTAARELTPGRLELDVSDLWAAQEEVLGVLRGCGAGLISLSRAGRTLEHALMARLSRR